MINIIIGGAPGSGKGTQSDLIVEKFKFKHLSTGDLLRAEIAAETDLGKKMKDTISKGELVPDDAVSDLLTKAIDATDNSYNGIIFDGYPRTVQQAKALEKIFQQRGMKIDIFIDIDVPDNVLIDRLLERGKIQGRADDNLKTIEDRIKIYHQQADKINNFYKKQNKYVNIYGLGGIQPVFEKIAACIRKLDAKL